MLWRSLATHERRAQPLRSALPVLAGALCVALPLLLWTARNARVFHVFQPLSPRNANDPGELVLHGFGRWYRSWAIDFASVDEVCWPMDGERIEFASLPPRVFSATSRSTSAEVRSRTAALIADYNATLTLTPALDARFDALAKERIHDHPALYYMGLPIARVFDMALRPRTELMPVADEWWRWREHRAQTAFAAFYAALNLAFYVVAFIGFSVWRRRGWSAPDPPGPGQRAFRELAYAMAASLLLRAAMLVFIDNSEPRYTLEFFPVFFVWIGALFAEPPLAVPPNAMREV
jgi:hypothetical protein